MHRTNPAHLLHAPYAEGVILHSPGSPRERRTLGVGPRWLPYAEGVPQNGGMTTCPSGSFVKPLRGIRPNTHRLPRVRRSRGDPGLRVQPLRGKETD